jgi:hypothetical protein
MLGSKKKMIETKISKNIVAIIAGVLIWFFFSLFNHKIYLLSISKDYIKYFPFFSVYTYTLIASIIAAFVVGLIGRSKGWILGLSFQTTIMVFLVLFFFFSTFVHQQMKSENADFANTLFKYIYRQLPWYFAAFVGGYLGGKARRSRR